MMKSGSARIVREVRGEPENKMCLWRFKVSEGAANGTWLNVTVRVNNGSVVKLFNSTAIINASAGNGSFIVRGDEFEQLNETRLLVIRNSSIRTVWPFSILFEAVLHVPMVIPPVVSPVAKKRKTRFYGWTPDEDRFYLAISILLLPSVIIAAMTVRKLQEDRTFKLAERDPGVRRVTRAPNVNTPRIDISTPHVDVLNDSSLDSDHPVYDNEQERREAKRV
jgi:hypothetical protein